MDFVTLFVIVVVIAVVGTIGLEIAKSNKKKEIDASISGLPGFRPTYKFMANDGQGGIAIDEGARKICLTSVNLGNPSHKIVSYKDLLEVETLENGHTVTKTSRTSQAATAILGGVLFGGVGAVVGALTSASKTEGKISRIDIKIVVNEIKSPIFLINFMDTECSRSGIIYEVANKNAMEWIGRLKVLMRLADDEDRAAELSGPSQKNSASISRADELVKLAKLRDDGILTDEEFRLEKQKILGSTTPPNTTAN